MSKRRIKCIQTGALTVALIGVLNIFGWYTHNRFLLSIHPEFPSMKINSAVNFILIGIALFFSVKPSDGKSRNLLSDTFAWLSLIYVSATFFGYIFNIDIGFGELLIRDYRAHEHPGWMSPFTAFGIFFMNVGLLLSQRESQILQTISQMLFHLATLIAGIIVLGYVYQNELMLNRFDNISAALLSGVTIAICSVCGAFLQPKQGVMGLFTGKLSGDKMSQVLFPVITLTLLMLTSVRIFIFRSYSRNDEFVTIIFFIIILVILLVTIHFTAIKLNRADYKRSIAEDKLQQLNERLETSIAEKTRELSQTLKLLQFATESARIGICELDLEGRFITANDIYFQELGLPPDTEKITSEQIMNLIVPEYRELFIQTIKNLEDKNSPNDAEIELLINTLYNGQRYFRYKGTKIFDGNGNVKKVRGIRIDITNYKEAEKNLTENLNLAKTLIEKAPSAIAMLDAEMRYVAASEQWFQDYNLQGQNVIEQSLYEIHPFLSETDKKIHQDALNGIPNVNKEGRSRRLPDGKLIWTTWDIRPWVGADNKVAGIIIQASDITDRKIAEQKVLESEKLFRANFENSAIGMTTVNTEGHFVMVNDTLCKMFGYTREEMLSLTFQEITHPDEHKAGVEALRKMLDNEIDFYTIEKRYIHKNGQVVYAMLSSTAIRDENNNIIHIFAHIMDISKQKKIELELAASEELFRANFENSAIGMTIIDTDGRWGMVNNTLCEMFGYTKEEMLSLTFHEITHPDDLKSNVGVFQKLLDNKSDFYTLEKRYIHKNGHIVYAMLSSNAIRDENGNIMHIFSQIMDVSKQKKMEHELATSEKLFRANFENSAIGMAALNTDGRWAMVNDTLCSMLGYTKEELLNLTYQHITHPDDLNGNVVALQRILDNKSDYYIIEKRYIHKNGQIVYGILSTTAIRDNNGDIVLMFSHVMDISKQKKAELELAASEEAFRGNFENASIGMALLDLDGNYKKVNSSFSQMLGYHIAEFETLNYRDIIHPDDLHKTTRKIENFQRDDFTELISEIRFFHKDGQIVHAIRSSSAIKNIDGSIKYIIVQCVDVTRQKLTDMSLRDILELTEGQNKSLKNFADIVSHNLRSHVGNIQMLNGLFLRKNPQFKEESVQSLIREATQELLETVFNLNQVKSLENNMNEMSSVNLYRTVQNAINNISGLAMNAKVKVINDLPEDCKIMGIPAYLDSVVLNFLTNAIKYRSRQRDSFIKLTLAKDEKHLTLNIEDNGLGIDLEKHRHELFKMYKTFHNHEDSRGIGLYITKNQIEAMGGHIDVMSEVNVGTTFKIYFRSAPSKIYINDSIEIDA